MNTDTRRLDPDATLSSRETWIRGLFMLLFTFILGFLQFAAGAVALVQFVFLLFGGHENENLRLFGRGLAAYAQEIVRFLSCDSEQKPFPFSPWPTGSA
ncbi:DUF4389 domain-containing protein [Geminicoccaceae bacterium 1502E]|nr:DUF4389 domain-containing protein [Geminicoccaceae bacterium 1502E]